MVVSTYKRPKSVRELLMGLQELDKVDRVRNWLLVICCAYQTGKTNQVIKDMLFMPIRGNCHFLLWLLQVIVLWNDANGSVPENLTQVLPEDKLLIVRPRENSLQNRFLPLDLIRTDAVLTLDDDVRISNYDYTLAFRWIIPSKM